MKRSRILILALLLISFGVAAQQQTAMRFNEVMLNNVSDLANDYGNHGQWIELFNSSYGTVDIAGCYISDDPNNLKKYQFPKGDLSTKIKPRQFAIVWAEGDASRGIFYANFKLNPGSTIYFVGGDGKTIIDQVQIPDMGENEVYARLSDGDGEWSVHHTSTPKTNNITNDGETKSQKMARMDPYGIIMAITAMSVVFFALIILYVIFKYIGKASLRSSKKKTASSNASEDIKAAVASSKEMATGETFAAIAMAFHLYNEENEAHDEESFVVTLQHTDRSYSPWSSKIYGLRETPQIKSK
ncbi:MAG: OadG family protein [Bacteroidales bacterium]|nr:OadG family protein [Bacteroidales bacterium]